MVAVQVNEFITPAVHDCLLELQDLELSDLKEALLRLENPTEFAITCLKAFIQQAFTGPSIPLDFKNRIADFSEYEDIYHLTPLTLLLLVAKIVLIDNRTIYNNLLWTYRCAFIIQRLLPDYNAFLQDIIYGCFDQLLKECETTSLVLEHGIVNHYYAQDKQAYKNFEKACNISNFNFQVTGVLGKRTKFQQSYKSQLVIKASSRNHNVEQDSINPMNLDLNDDTILDKMELDESDDLVTGQLETIDQTILLAFCLNVKNTNPVDGITTEQMFPYVTRVLETPKNWLVTTMALLLRSRLESTKSRTVERSCLQLQALVDQWKVLENDAPASERLEYFFCLLVPSKWEMEQELGKRYCSIGVIRSALEIFERLEIWEDVISCHQMLEQPKKAKELIERLLQEKETPKLYCLLGDVCSDYTLYEKAWELSNASYSRAMRSLGAHYFRQKDCYQKALEINSLFENSWFVMGCAAMYVEDFAVAANAYNRVTKIDHDNGEAWNNLASVHIKQKKLQEAFMCLKEALRCSYDASNIWENYLFVCCDIGEFGEAIRAAERVFQIRINGEKQKHVAIDYPVLEIIVDAVIKDIPDANQQPSSVHLKKLYRFLDNVLLKVSSPNIYSILAKLHFSQQNYDKYFEYTQEMYRKTLHDPLILESLENFARLSECAIKFVECLRQVEEHGVISDAKYQSKMVLKAVIGRSKSLYEGTDAYEKLVEAKESLTE